MKGLERIRNWSGLPNNVPSPSGRGEDENRTNKKRPNEDEGRYIYEAFPSCIRDLLVDRLDALLGDCDAVMDSAVYSQQWKQVWKSPKMV